MVSTINYGSENPSVFLHLIGNKLLQKTDFEEYVEFPI